MSVKKLQKLFDDDQYDVEPEDLGEIVEDNEWISNGKYDHRDVVVHITEGDVYEHGFYKISYSRTGSYYSDYEFYTPIVTKVEPYQETVTRYRVVKQG